MNPCSFSVVKVYIYKALKPKDSYHKESKIKLKSEYN